MYSRNDLFVVLIKQFYLLASVTSVKKRAESEPIVKTEFSQLLFERVNEHEQEIFAVEKLVESVQFRTKSTEFLVALYQTTTMLSIRNV